MLPLDGQKSVNLRDERHQLIRVLFVRSKFAKLHPLLFLLGQSSRPPSRKDVQQGSSTNHSKSRIANLPVVSVRTTPLRRGCPSLGLAFQLLIYSTKRAGFSYSILCREPSGGIRHPRWDFPRRLVTPETKIRQLCARLIAAENDEAAERMLHELKQRAC